MKIYKPKENDAQQYYYFNNGFNQEELDWISNNVERLEFERAQTALGKPDPVRTSNIKWIPHTEEWDWLYQKLMHYAEIANNELWHFDLHSAPENIQYTEYYATENGHYGWHQDLGPGELSIRKVSMTVQLSDDTEYEGGDLQFWYGGDSLEECDNAPKGKGTVVIFPSYLNHAVKPVTKGTRKSFVLWLGGGHFK
jgi:PKHD-type hydroxylase